MSNLAKHFSIAFTSLVLVVGCIWIFRLFLQGKIFSRDPDVRWRLLTLLALMLCNIIQLISQCIALYNEPPWGSPSYVVWMLCRFGSPAAHSMALIAYVKLLLNRYRRFFMILSKSLQDTVIRIFFIAYLIFHSVKIGISAWHYYGRLAYPVLPNYITNDNFPFTAILSVVALLTEEYVHANLFKCTMDQLKGSQWKKLKWKMMGFALVLFLSALSILFLYLGARYAQLLSSDIATPLAIAWFILHALVSFALLDTFAIKVREAKTLGNETTSLSKTDIVSKGLISDISRTPHSYNLTNNINLTTDIVSKG